MLTRPQARSIRRLDVEVAIPPADPHGDQCSQQNGIFGEGPGGLTAAHRLPITAPHCRHQLKSQEGRHAGHKKPVDEVLPME